MSPISSLRVASKKIDTLKNLFVRLGKGCMGAVPGNGEPIHSLSDSIQLMNTIKLSSGTNTISHFSNEYINIFKVHFSLWKNTSTSK